MGVSLRGSEQKTVILSGTDMVLSRFWANNPLREACKSQPVRYNQIPRLLGILIIILSGSTGGNLQDSLEEDPALKRGFCIQGS